MFDFAPPVAGDETINFVRRFFSDHGHELVDAARLLGGAAAETRVVSCAIHLENVSSVDTRVRRDLAALQRLLALQDVGDPDRIETELFSGIDPACRQVETICMLTERIEDLLQQIQPRAGSDRRSARNGAIDDEIGSCTSLDPGGPPKGPMVYGQLRRFS